MVNIANMMKQAQAMQKKLLEAQEELAKKIILEMLVEEL